jgi:hypothetical protein
MAPRENNLSSLRGFVNAAIVHRVGARFALEAFIADINESAGKMPALSKPLQTIPQKMKSYFTPLAGSHQPFARRI